MYEYNKDRYFVSVKLTTLFMLVLILYALPKWIIDPGINIYILIVVAATYGVFNNFISLSTPNKIEINENIIVFSAFGRKHEYRWEEITSLKIKELADKKMYIRINDGSLLRGRYWIKTRMYNDSDKLFNFFRKKEEELHPDSIKFRRKRSDKVE